MTKISAAENITRFTLGGCIVPLVPTAILIAFFWIHNIRPDSYGLPSYYHAQAIARTSFNAAGFLTLGLGMWPYKKLKPYGWGTLRHFAVAGLMLGPMAGLFFLVADHLDPALRNESPASPLAWLEASIFIGTVTTTIFWLIARPDRVE